MVISGNYRNTSLVFLRAHGTRAELLVSSSRSPPRARGDDQQMHDLRVAKGFPVGVVGKD
jgi:hypothetical protein